MNNAIETCDAIADSYFEEFNQPSDHIDDFVNVLKPNSCVLDLGCGPGVDSAYLCKKGFRIYGVDASANMLAIAKKNAPGARFEIGDMRTFDYPLEEYDGIIASYSLIHIQKEDVPTVLDKLSKALKPLGYLFIGLQMGKSEEVELIEPLNPDLKIFVNVFSKSEMHNLLNIHGFEILKEHERASENAEEFDFIKYCALARKGK